MAAAVLGGRLFLHTTTGGWTVPVVVLIAVLAGELAVYWQAGRAVTLHGVLRVASSRPAATRRARGS